MRRLMVLVTLMVLSGACFAGEKKIAVVDMSKLLKAHPETERAESVLEDQVKEIEAEKTKLMDSLEQARDEVDSLMKQVQNKALSEKKRDGLREQAEEKYKKLRQMDFDAKKALDSRKQDLNEQRMIMHKRIVEKISEVVREYARDKGYAFVMDSAAVGVSGMPVLVYSEEAANITADIEKLILKKK